MNPATFLLAWVAAGFVTPACTDLHAAPAPDSVCAVRHDAEVTHIDIFDGDPAELVSLAPDDDRNTPNTYTVKDIYAQGRHVTVRCHYGKTSLDVILRNQISRCEFSGGDAHPAMVCH